MFVYKNVLGKLKDAGYSSYRIRNEGLFSEETIQALRTGNAVNIKTLDAICQILNCPIEEVVEIRKDRR